MLSALNCSDLSKTTTNLSRPFIAMPLLPSMLWAVAGKTKPKRVWIYVGNDDEKRIDSLLRRFPHLSEAAVMASLLSAALRCCEREGFLAIPYEFTTLENLRDSPALRLNDKEKAK
jgi:hypothetical protein